MNDRQAKAVRLGGFILIALALGIEYDFTWAMIIIGGAAITMSSE